MEINFSRARLMQVAAALLVITAAVFAYQTISASELLAFLHPEAVDNIEAHNTQPAMQALTTIYTPNGEKADWEQSACANMTVKGCELFKTYYANPIWQTGLKGTQVTFVDVRDALKDGTQVWQTEATAANGIAQPIFIQVEQRADGQWLLARILFEEEAQKYAE